MGTSYSVELVTLRRNGIPRPAAHRWGRSGDKVIALRPLRRKATARTFARSAGSLSNAAAEHLSSLRHLSHAPPLSQRQTPRALAVFVCLMIISSWADREESGDDRLPKLPWPPVHLKSTSESCLVSSEPAVELDDSPAVQVPEKHVCSILTACACMSRCNHQKHYSTHHSRPLAPRQPGYSPGAHPRGRGALPPRAPPSPL